MPVYEYECTSCGKRHEVIRKFSDPPLTRCPACKGRLRKLISKTSFVLKGSGWYVTDYARKDTGNGKKKKEHADKGGEKISGNRKEESSAKEEAKSKGASEPESKVNEKKSSESKSP